MGLKSKIESIFKEKPEDTGYSSSKLWFNIFNVCATTMYVMIGLAATKANPLPIEPFAWLTLVMAGVITTNKFANKFLEYKYGQTTTVTVAPTPTGEK
jgi:hypothetical protein